MAITNYEKQVIMSYYSIVTLAFHVSYCQVMVCKWSDLRGGGMRALIIMIGSIINIINNSYIVA